MTMTRDEVFRATGPASGRQVTRQDRRQEGRHASSPPSAIVKLQAGAFPGSPVGTGLHVRRFACYDIHNFQIDGFDVVSNRPKVAAYRAPGAPISAFGPSSARIDDAGAGARAWIRSTSA